MSRSEGLARKSAAAVKISKGWAHWNWYCLILLTDDLRLSTAAFRALITSVLKSFFLFEFSWRLDLQGLFKFDVFDIKWFYVRFLSEGGIDCSESGRRGESNNESESD